MPQANEANGVESMPMYGDHTAGGIVVDEDYVDDARYRVIFLRDFKRGVRIAEIREKLRQRFNLSKAGVDRMFAGRSLVVKENVDAQVAYEYKRAIDETGASSKIEIMRQVANVNRVAQKRRKSVHPAKSPVNGRKRRA